MKTTAQRLSEVYCRPKGAKEWGMFGLIDIGTNYAVWSVDGKATVTDCNLPELFTQIPVQHFIDLIEDNIVAWRLVEDGFKELAKGVWSWSDDGHQILISFERELNVMLSYSDQGMIPMCGCETYTDLITLINLLK
jgi:hypothetical protein